MDTRRVRTPVLVIYYNRYLTNNDCSMFVKRVTRRYACPTLERHLGRKLFVRAGPRAKDLVFADVLDVVRIPQRTRLRQDLAQEPLALGERQRPQIEVAEAEQVEDVEERGQLDRTLRRRRLRRGSSEVDGGRGVLVARGRREARSMISASLGARDAGRGDQPGSIEATCARARVIDGDTIEVSANESGLLINGTAAARAQAA